MDKSVAGLFFRTVLKGLIKSKNQYWPSVNTYSVFDKLSSLNFKFVNIFGKYRVNATNFNGRLTFCRTHFSIPPHHSNILTVDKDFVNVFAVSFLHFLVTSLRSIVDYELLAILLPENTENKFTLTTYILCAYSCYQRRLSFKLSVFCPILAKNWNVSIYLSVDPKFEIQQKHFTYEFSSLRTERRTDLATPEVTFRELISEHAWKLIGVSSASGETRIQMKGVFYKIMWPAD
jgi:hypothetical protein